MRFWYADSRLRQSALGRALWFEIGDFQAKMTVPSVQLEAIMIFGRGFLSLGLIGLIAIPGMSQDPGPIPAGQFEKIHALIKRGEGEWKWAELPWAINFADAQRRSLMEGKPIFAVMCAQGCVAGFT
jgi:hypothetical protein